MLFAIKPPRASQAQVASRAGGSLGSPATRQRASARPLLIISTMLSETLATPARRWGTLTVLALALGSSPTRAEHPPARTLRLTHAHHSGRLAVQLIDAQGQIRRPALTKLRAFLACHKTGADHPIHWRLASMLLSISAHWPTKTILVHSGYRDPSVSHHAKRSNHTRGRAIDIRIPGVPNRDLFETLRRSFRGVGLGYYPNSSFVHLDVREHSAIWVDYAGPGQPACYSKSPAQDLKNGVAERLTWAMAKRRGCR